MYVEVDVGGGADASSKLLSSWRERYLDFNHSCLSITSILETGRSDDNSG
jgi:hypothetical protein